MQGKNIIVPFGPGEAWKFSTLLPWRQHVLWSRKYGNIFATCVLCCVVLWEAISRCIVTSKL